MKATLLLLFCATVVGGCVVNPDADRSLKDDRRRDDSIAAANRGVVQPMPDTGQHDMPVIQPTAPTQSDMPVVNPADSAGRRPL